MPITRSQKGERGRTDEEVKKIVYDSPASPSGQNMPVTDLSTAIPRAENRHYSGDREPRTTDDENPRNTEPPRVRDRAESVRSTASTAARIRQAELQAEEKLAEIKRRELRLEAELIRKRLALDIATIREETDRESLPAEDIRGRVDEWIRKYQEIPSTTEQLESRDPPKLLGAARGERDGKMCERDRLNKEQSRFVHPRRQRLDEQSLEGDRERRRAPSPRIRRDAEPADLEYRPLRDLSPRRERIEDIAGAFRGMTRPVPRQAQDLPVFSGEANEWLPFKAAMRESTKMFHITPAENLARLRICLTGEAKETVSALLYTAADPLKIMRTLEQVYGRPEAIIDRTLEGIKNLPGPGKTAYELNTFATKLQNIVQVLENLDDRGYLNNPTLIKEVLRKLGEHLKSKWCDFAEENEHHSEPPIAMMSRFLMQQANRAIRHAYEKVEPREGAARRAEGNTGRRWTPRRAAATVLSTSKETAKPGEPANKEKGLCFCCGENHKIATCDKFKKLALQQRWDWIKGTGICFKCLNGKHRKNECKEKPCGVHGCEYAHHALLHKYRDSETVASVRQDAVAPQVLLKVCPVVVRGPKKSVRAYALLDEGSTLTIVDEDLAEEIGAEGPPSDLCINSISARQCLPDSKQVSLQLIANQGRYSIKARTMKNLSIGGQRVDRRCLNYAHLTGIKPRDVCYDDAKPRLLIGTDNWHLIVTRKLLTGKRNEPAASLSRLGWTIHGCVPRATIQNDRILHIATVEQRNSNRDTDELYDAVRKHFEIDSLGITSKERLSAADEQAVNLFSSSTRQVNGRYEVRLPWKEKDRTMPPSYENALKRLRIIERKMDRSPDFKMKYTAQIENMLNKGYATKATSDERLHPRQWYLPHFAVTNPNKPGKIRVVHDAAAKVNGICLNDTLLEGPDLLQNLPGMLCRFRERNVAVTADIREMFLQIKICPEDQPAQMFLWRGEEREKPPTQYKMTSLIFGAKSSPFLAHSVRNLNARNHAVEYPRALVAITRDHYMDDWVASYDSVSEARTAVQQVAHVHARAGFQLAGWNASDPSVLENISNSERAVTTLTPLGTTKEQYGRTLGLIWDASTDELAFNTNLIRVPSEVKEMLRAPTKREMLSTIMSIFDPLGLLSYFTITAKILLQNVWRLNVGWDDRLPETECDDFREWLSGLEMIKELRLPRLYHSTGGVARWQLHVFCDASADAYATAIYWRMTDREGKVRVSLAMAKARVTPLKTQSIPRLELQAALIGARLARMVIREHEWQPERVVYWSDSQTVLHWIREDKVRHTPYVAHRITEIKELTDAKQWRWIPTDLNVADEATRANSDNKKSSDRWFSGPEFLRDEEENWPQSDERSTESESAEVHTLRPRERSVLSIERFSQYERLVRVISNVLLFPRRCRSRATTQNLALIEEAERILTQTSQRESFPDDIERLRKGQPVGRDSKLRKLDPYIDENGTLRAKGRISASTVTTIDPNPIVLDGQHHFTRLLIDREHRRAHHSYNERVVNDI